MMEIIFENANLIVVNKPAGIESVASQNKGKSISEVIQLEKEDTNIKPVHRLDRDTTGTMVFAKNLETLGKLEAFFKERKTIKRYLALCVGIPRNQEGVIRRNLSNWTGGHKPVRVVKGGGGLSAETEYKVIASSKKNGASLIMFTPHQGRTHQIRVHAEAFGRPIIGDHQYGNREYNRKIKDNTGLKRQALHAWQLILPEMNENGEDLEFEAPLHDDFIKTCDNLLENWKASLSKEQNNEFKNKKNS